MSRHDFQQVRCLIVDSDPYMRRMVRGMLRQTGLGEIEEAKDGLQAQYMAEQSQFQLIIMELNLPNLNGKGLALALRRSANKLNSIIPIIGYSAAISHELVAETRDAGINEIVVRPFSLAVLVKKINLVLLSPRPFIVSPTYIGPCRRRRTDGVYIGPKRREMDRIKESADKLREAVQNAEAQRAEQERAAASSQAALLGQLRNKP